MASLILKTGNNLRNLRLCDGVNLEAGVQLAREGAMVRFVAALSY